MKNMKYKEMRLSVDSMKKNASNFSIIVILETFKMKQSYKTLKQMMQFSKEIS